MIDISALISSIDLCIPVQIVDSPCNGAQTGSSKNLCTRSTLYLEKSKI